MDVTQIMDEMAEDYTRLDQLEKGLEKAIEVLDRAEYAWLEVYDAVSEALKSEMEEAGRKGDPAEHTIESAARRQHRVTYTNWRRAKHARDMIQTQIKTKQVSLSGRQTHLNALRAETYQQPSQGGQRQQPSWSPRAA